MWGILPMVAGGIPLAVLWAALVWDRRNRKKSGERPPQSEKLLRPPGYGLSLQIEDLAENFSGWMMGAYLSALVSVGFFSIGMQRDQSSRLTTVVIFTLLSAGCTLMAWRTHRAMRRYRLGWRGELSVAEHLQNLIAGGYHLFHDVPGDGKWNIDHVAVGPAGVFAIETKARTKRPGPHREGDHEAVFDGKAIHFPMCADTKSPQQAERNAKWLANMLSRSTGERVEVRAIVALPGWWVTLKVNSHIKVLSGKQVPGFISKELTQLSSKAIQQISYQLEQRCRDVEF